MRLTLSLEYRFAATPDGRIWTSETYAYPFWERYLREFSSVRVVARVLPVQTVPRGGMRADGKGVVFQALPYYQGPRQYVQTFLKLRRCLQAVDLSHDAVIFRIGSQLAAMLTPALQKTAHPYGLEVVGDPYDAFAPGAIRHPLRFFFRLWFAAQQKRQCMQATAVTYVTQSVLQKRYPAAKHAFAVAVSDVELPAVAIASHPREPRGDARSYQLIMVGSLAQMYKAPDVLIDALALCVAKGYDLQLSIVGDGRHRRELEERAASLGLAPRVQFCGQLPAGEAVRAQLDQADIFVLPSRTEGLPRAMLEAMARGLPCIGSNVGGIPELLPAEDLVPPGDPQALAQKIEQVVTHPERLAAMSARNLRHASAYREDLLDLRRTQFLQYVKQMTQTWLDQRQ